MTKEFSCVRNISAIQQSFNVTTCRGKFESYWIICSFIICYESDISSFVDIGRYQIFKYRGNSEIRSLSPTRHVSGEHRTYREEQKSHQQIEHGLSLTIDKVSMGQCQCHCLITQNLNKTVFKKCGCQKGYKKNCKCIKVEMMKCLPTCKCKEKCKES